MSEVTVKQFAEVVGVPTDRLLAQLGEAGLEIQDENATITETQKTQLLDFLRESHGRHAPVTGAAPKKITLKRKSHTELHTSVPAARPPGARGAVRGAKPEKKTVIVVITSYSIHYTKLYEPGWCATSSPVTSTTMSSA